MLSLIVFCPFLVRNFTLEGASRFLQCRSLGFDPQLGIGNGQNKPRKPKIVQRIGHFCGCFGKLGLSVELASQMARGRMMGQARWRTALQGIHLPGQGAGPLPLPHAPQTLRTPRRLKKKKSSKRKSFGRRALGSNGCPSFCTF